MKTAAEREAVRQEIERIEKKNGGRLDPKAVVLEARSNKESALHAQFNWDTKAAAMEHWVERAREIIRTVRVVVKTERTSISVVAYVRDPDLGPNETGYVSTVSLIGDSERSRAALVTEFSRAAGALRRARELAIAFDMTEEIDAVTNQVELMRTKIEASVEQSPATN